MKRAILFVGVLLLLSVYIEAKKGRSKVRGKTCNIPCIKKLEPVCASDGKTYNNLCLFNNAKCSEANKTGSVLEVKARGPCRNGTGKSIKEKANCSAGLVDCVRVGNSSKKAVCASDNKTYLSFCFFRVARCQAKKNRSNLTVLYKGECGKPKPTKTKQCPVASQCDNRDQPICGSDRKIYRNMCLFVVAKCEIRRRNGSLTQKKKGVCSRKPPKHCPKTCSPNERPVCGSDNKTYKNDCHLHAAKCALSKKDRGSLRLQYNGPCGAPVTPKPCPRWEDCKMMDKPVCGSDGKTYPNICRLRVAICHARRNKHKTIKFKYRGACKKRKNGKNTDRKGKKGKKEKRGKKNRNGSSKGRKGSKGRRD